MEVLICGSDIAVSKVERALEGLGARLRPVPGAIVNPDPERVQSVALKADVAILEIGQPAVRQAYCYWCRVWRLPIVLLIESCDSDWAELVEMGANGFLCCRMPDREFASRLKAILRRQVPEVGWKVKY